MQADANRYGESVFITSILEILPEASTSQEISDREQHYTHQAHAYGKCYNPRLAVLRKSERVCLICGSVWPYGKNMCATHYTAWLQVVKKGYEISPENYIAYRKNLKKWYWQKDFIKWYTNQKGKQS
jgi:hypothetical protein